MSKHTFSSLGEDQKRDLMLYFYERNSKKTDVRLQPKYEFCLEEFRGYFGFDPKSIRRGVMRSEEYYAFHEERSRPPPPPEMSLLTRALIAACLLCPLPPAAGDAGERIRERDRWEREHASEVQVVRKSDREGKGILFSEGMPIGVGEERRYICGEGKKAHKRMGPGWDRHKAMVCNMQKTIEAAADYMYTSSTATKRAIFDELIEEEKQKHARAGVTVDKSARAPYKARAALDLVLLFTSTLGYHSSLLVMISVSVICAYSAMLAFLFDSLSPIFQEHDEEKKRDGSELRLQLEGNFWHDTLDLWLADQTEIAAFLAREGTSQARAEPEADASHRAKRGKASNAKIMEPLPDPSYPIRAKLEMGLAILLQLAHTIHHAALNSPPLKEEPGCEHLADPLELYNTSLLVSVLRKLEPYPGSKAKGLGDKGVRFHAEQRARLPPDGAAPRARVRIVRFSFLF